MNTYQKLWLAFAASLLVCGAFSCMTQGQVHGGINDFGLNSKVVAEEDNYSCTPKPPQPRPATHSGAESVPPLPLPAVPLRRTEKKNPPRPPVLVIKIKTNKQSDWATNPQDINNLLIWMADSLNVNFSTQNKTMQEIFGTKQRHYTETLQSQNQ